MNRLRVTGTSEEVRGFVHAAGAGEGIDAEQALEAAGWIAEGESGEELAKIATVLCGENGPISFWHHAPLPGGRWDYDVAVRTWGTKWDACEAEIVGLSERGGVGEAVYRFETAWGPPVGWLAAASGAHPGLEFRLLWNEEQGLCGGIDARDGAVEECDLEWDELCEEWDDAPFAPYEDADR